MPGGGAGLFHPIPLSLRNYSFLAHSVDGPPAPCMHRSLLIPTVTPPGRGEHLARRRGAFVQRRFGASAWRRARTPRAGRGRCTCSPGASPCHGPPPPRPSPTSTPTSPTPPRPPKLSRRSPMSPTSSTPHERRAPPRRRTASPTPPCSTPCIEGELTTKFLWL